MDNTGKCCAVCTTFFQLMPFLEENGTYPSLTLGVCCVNLLLGCNNFVIILRVNK